jgi:hypothetical protein
MTPARRNSPRSRQINTARGDDARPHGPTRCGALPSPSTGPARRVLEAQRPPVAGELAQAACMRCAFLMRDWHTHRPIAVVERLQRCGRSDKGRGRPIARLVSAMAASELRNQPNEGRCGSISADSIVTRGTPGRRYPTLHEERPWPRGRSPRLSACWMRFSKQPLTGDGFWPVAGILGRQLRSSGSSACRRWRDFEVAIVSTGVAIRLPVSRRWWVPAVGPEVDVANGSFRAAY